LTDSWFSFQIELLIDGDIDLPLSLAYSERSEHGRQRRWSDGDKQAAWRNG